MSQTHSVSSLRRPLTHLPSRYHHNVAARHGGKLPPETRLVMGMVGAVLAPIGLFWMAFTTYRAVPWILPIVASSLFGAAVYYIFTAVFTYLVTAYRPIAASAMASNTALRCAFAIPTGLVSPR